MSSMVRVTFIRHGESMDNLKSIWAGWKDAPLSNDGMAQARACGQFFATTRFTAIHASPLKRAFSTAQAVYDSQPSPKPPFTTSLLVREQHFGIAEGHTWMIHRTPGLSLQEHYAKGIFPVLYERSEKFQDGESLDDLRERAERAIEELVMPYVWDCARSGWKEEGVHVAIVSHGLCISELIAALMRKNEGGVGKDGGKWTGLLNTAWTRVAIDIKGLQEGQTLDIDTANPPPLKVQVTDVNKHDHLNQIKRQPGGIGSAAHDPAQQDIRKFFGGGPVPPEEPPSEEGRSASNVYDETMTEDK